MQRIDLLRVVVASPNDVQTERDSVDDVIASVNHFLKIQGKNVRLEVSRWETDAYPAVHPEGPQALIDSVLRIADCDILVGIFWKRFGTPVEDAGSGTEHEIYIAYEAWKANGKPEIMLYFNQRRYTPKLPEETEQWNRVLELKRDFSIKGVVWEYESKSRFADMLLSHLLSYATRKVQSDLPVERERCMQAMADPALLRAEGITELVGAINLTFDGAMLTEILGTSQTFDIRLFFNVFVTNRVTIDRLTDATLHIGIAPSDVRIPGQLIEVNALEFKNIPLAKLRDIRTYASISGVRVDASMLGWPAGRQLYGVTATASVWHQHGQEIPDLEAVTVVVGLVKGSLAFRIWTSDGREGPPFRFSRSQGVNADLLDKRSSNQADITFYLQFSELLPGAFRTTAEETAEFGDSGTRLEVIFDNVQTGIQIFVTTRNVAISDDGSPKAMLVEDENTIPADDSVIAAITAISTNGVPLTQLSIKNGHAAAAWEWLGTDRISRIALEDLHFGIIVAARPGEALLGSASLSARYVPSSQVHAAATSEPVPRFVHNWQSVTVLSFDQ